VSDLLYIRPSLSSYFYNPPPLYYLNLAIQCQPRHWTDPFVVDCFAVLTLLEFTVRHHLAEQHEKLAGLYVGNPKRVTSRPTAEAILKAFKDITLPIVTIEQQIHRHIAPLSELQQKILILLDFPLDIYTRLCVDSFYSP